MSVLPFQPTLFDRGLPELDGPELRATPPELRPYQAEAIARIHTRLREGIRRLLLVLATGGGKTVIAAHLVLGAVAEGKRVLFLAHRRELIHQAYAKFRAQGLSDRQVGVLMATDSRRRPGAPVQVASVDTLRRRAPPLADVVFVDEAHRSLAATYRGIAELYPNAVHLGLTATPYRRDGGGLGDAYDELVVVATVRQLIADGFLVEPRVFTVPRDTGPDVSGVRTKGGDYEEGALARAVDRPGLVGNIVHHWQELAEGLRTVVFAVSIAHSKHIVQSFREAGVAAAHLDGATPTDERDRILAALERGELRVVSSCGILSEGWDQPAVKCAVLARPTRSTGLYLQQVGRILRPWNGVRAIILDHAGSVHAHGLPQDDRVFSLDPRQHIAQAAPVRACPVCSAMVPLSTRVCPECDAVLIEGNFMPEEAEGQLVEISQDKHERAEWDRFCALALERGYQPGWVYHRWKEKFGKEPPRSFRVPRPAPRPAPGGGTRAQEAALRDVLKEAARGKRTLSWSEIDRLRSGG
jgi:superfamily II DNA or RNA helicase